MLIELDYEVISEARRIRSLGIGQQSLYDVIAAVAEAADNTYIDPPQSLVDNLATRAHHSTAVRYTRGPESAYSFLRKRDAE